MRYLPLTPENRRAMLERAGVSSVEEFYDDIPDRARLADPVAMPFAQSEWAVERAIAALAAENLPASGARAFFLGGGAYRHHVPASVDHIIQRSEFLTTYTPYQPEIAQGTLQSLFEFQSQIAILTGMEVANSSMYDGASAAAEAALMAARVTRRRKIVVSGGLHPHYAETVATVAGAASLEIHRLPAAIDAEAATLAALDDDTACIMVQSPNFFGTLTDVSAIAEVAHARGALLIFVFTEVVSLGLLRSPGEMGADIVVGEGQSLGNGLNFGGPYVGLFAAREKFLRQMPGRLAGQTVDLEGRRGFVLTLSAREQHIRRERATSNICTNSGLCALALTAHLTLLGGGGLHALAMLNHEAAIRLADTLVQVPGVTLETPSFFNELTVRLPRPAAQVVDRLALMGILGGLPASRLLPDAGLDDLLVLAATELNQPDDYPRLAAALAAALVD